MSLSDVSILDTMFSHCMFTTSVKIMSKTEYTIRVQFWDFHDIKGPVWEAFLI